MGDRTPPKRQLPIPSSSEQQTPATPWWYTAEQITRRVSEVLAEAGYPGPVTGDPVRDAHPVGTGQGVRWLKEGVNFLRDAHKHGDLARCLVEPETSIDVRWDTFIAATIRYRLRTLGFTTEQMPKWTFKPPLEKLWFVSAATPARATTAMNQAPTELRRVGILIPESTFDYAAKLPGLPSGEHTEETGR